MASRAALFAASIPTRAGLGTQFPRLVIALPFFGVIAKAPTWPASAPESALAEPLDEASVNAAGLPAASHSSTCVAKILTPSLAGRAAKFGYAPPAALEQGGMAS